MEEGKPKPEIDTSIGSRDRTKERPPNCFGRAFFLTGMTSDERCVIVNNDGTIEGGGNIEDLPLLGEPQIGCLAFIRSRLDRAIEHVGVVTQLAPLLMTDRNNMDGPVREDVDINHLLVNYPRGPHIVEYRLPIKGKFL